MKESYLQHYLNENYMLLAMVIGTYFVVAMKSAVDTFIKKRMITQENKFLSCFYKFF